MADLKPFLGLWFSIFFWIPITTSVAADPSLQELEALHLPSELEKLKLKISFLESKIGEIDYELRKKDQIILQLGKSIRAKSNKVVTLESEIAFLRQKRPSDSKEHTRTDELEKQVCGSCQSGFPVHISHLQTLWNESGKPVANKAYRELLERKAQIQQWLRIQVEIIVTEWIPNLIEQCLVFTTYLKPHVRRFATKTVDMCYKVKNYAVPQAVQFFQETKVFTKPYIDQMVTVAKLHLENAQLTLQKNVAGAYQKIVAFAASYHHQVRGGWHSRWFVDRLSNLQSIWNENGGPVAKKAYQKLLESKAQVWQWLDIHR